MRSLKQAYCEFISGHEYYVFKIKEVDQHIAVEVIKCKKCGKTVVNVTFNYDIPGKKGKSPIASLSGSWKYNSQNKKKDSFKLELMPTALKVINERIAVSLEDASKMV